MQRKGRGERTCRIMSPGSMRPSRATAPPFMMLATKMPPSPRRLDWPTMEMPRKLTLSMLRGTVMMLRDMEDSVMEEKEVALLTGARCFLRRLRWR